MPSLEVIPVDGPSRSIVLNANGRRRDTKVATLLAVCDPTTSYIPTNFVFCGWAEKVTFDFAFVHSDGTSFEYYYEWSPDGQNWYRSINLATSAGVNTLTGNNQTYAVAASLNAEDCVYAQNLFVRVQIQRTGGAATNTVSVKATLLSL